MKVCARLAAVLLAATGLAASAAPALAPIEGLWRTPTDHGQVRIETCGGKVCGRLVTSDRLRAFPDQRDVRNRDKGLRERMLKGVLIAQGFSGGPMRWSGGTVYDPAGGGTYSGRIELTEAGTLKLTGCIVAPMCRSQIWTRVRPN